MKRLIYFIMALVPAMAYGAGLTISTTNGVGFDQTNRYGLTTNFLSTDTNFVVVLGEVVGGTGRNGVAQWDGISAYTNGEPAAILDSAIVPPFWSLNTFVASFTNNNADPTVGPYVLSAGASTDHPYVRGRRPAFTVPPDSTLSLGGVEKGSWPVPGIATNGGYGTANGFTNASFYTGITNFYTTNTLINYISHRWLAQSNFFDEVAGLDATNQGGISFTNGIYGTNLAFFADNNDVSAFATIPSTDVIFSNEYSVSFWFKADQLCWAMTDQNPVSGGSGYPQVTGGQASLNVNGSGVVNVGSGLNDGNWHFVGFARHADMTVDAQIDGVYYPAAGTLLNSSANGSAATLRNNTSIALGVQTWQDVVFATKPFTSNEFNQMWSGGAGADLSFVTNGTYDQIILNTVVLPATTTFGNQELESTSVTYANGSVGNSTVNSGSVQYNNSFGNIVMNASSIYLENCRGLVIQGGNSLNFTNLFNTILTEQVGESSIGSGVIMPTNINVNGQTYYATNNSGVLNYIVP